MPEMPEVETVVRGLRKTIIGRRIIDVKIKPTAQIFPDKKEFSKIIKGAVFEKAERRGKNILLGLDNDFTLWVHLKMTGHFYYLPSSEPVGKHDHVVFELENDGHNLRFNDYRRFGRLRLFPSLDLWKQPGLADLGPEPLDMSADDFVNLVRSRRRMIKPALMDQTFIAGLGNIYADESLFLSRLHPMRLTDSISRAKLRELFGHIQCLFSKSIRMMGTSVDTFAGVNAQPGKFQNYLQVYGRDGESCVHCGTVIKRQKIGSRSAHFCPRCQRVK